MVEVVRIVLVGSDPLALEGLRHLLSDEIRDAQIETATPETIPPDAMPTAADVIVWDVSSETNLVLRPDTPVVALVSDSPTARNALAAGARGVLPRDAPTRRLARAIEAVMEDLVVVDDEIADEVRRAPAAAVPMLETMTPREMEVLQELALGQTNKEIASRLGISPHTAKFHVNSLMAKLGAASRTEVVAMAARAGLVTF